MKKLTALLLGICTITSIARAQKADSTKAIVHYKFSHLRDTTKINEPYTENMVLLLGTKSSVYKSFDLKMQDAMMKKQVAEQMAAATPGGPIKISIKGGRASTTEYFMYPATNKMIRKEKLVNNYLIEEPIPAIKWQISNDTASFSGLKCQKATTHFAGRDYTAWFCPDLPFRSGPWKLNGLPGLIVEAYDTNKQVEFKFDGLDDESKIEKTAPGAAEPGTIQSGGSVVKIVGVADDAYNPSVIALPANGIKTNNKEFNNLKEAMKKDPAAFIQSAMAGSASNFKPGSINNSKFNVNSGPVINNPLELPEKK
ncbi:GLPGLI family protein [Mucilaginibacter phyllosphaerae]